MSLSVCSSLHIQRAAAPRTSVVARRPCTTAAGRPCTEPGTRRPPTRPREPSWTTTHWTRGRRPLPTSQPRPVTRRLRPPRARTHPRHRECMGPTTATHPRRRRTNVSAVEQSVPHSNKWELVNCFSTSLSLSATPFRKTKISRSSLYLAI